MGKTCFCTEDVKHLFTNVHIDDTIADAAVLLSDRCAKWGLSVDEWTDLLRTCIKEATFTFNEELFIQINAVVMGSPLGPTLADLFIRKVEAEISALICGLVLWVRYVDVFFIIKAPSPSLEDLAILNTLKRQKYSYYFDLMMLGFTSLFCHNVYLSLHSIEIFNRFYQN